MYIAYTPGSNILCSFWSTYEEAFRIANEYWEDLGIVVTVEKVAQHPLRKDSWWFMLPMSSQFTDERHSHSCWNLRWLLYNLVWAFKTQEPNRSDLQSCYKPTDGFEHQRSQCFGDLNYVRTCFWVYLWRFSEWCFSGRMGWMGTTCSGTWSAVRLLFARVRCMWQLRRWHKGGCKTPQTLIHYIRTWETPHVWWTLVWDSRHAWWDFWPGHSWTQRWKVWCQWVPERKLRLLKWWTVLKCCPLVNS